MRLPSAQAVLAVPRDAIERFWRLHFHPSPLAVVKLLVEEGVLAKLEQGPSTAEGLRQAWRRDDLLLEKLLTLGNGLELLERDAEGSWRPGLLARLFLVAEAPLPLGGLLQRCTLLLSVASETMEGLQRLPFCPQDEWTREVAAELQASFFRKRHVRDQATLPWFLETGALLLHTHGREARAPATVCDVGAGPAPGFARLLKQLYPQARVVAADITYGFPEVQETLRRFLPDGEVETLPVNLLRERLPFQPELVTANRLFHQIPRRGYGLWAQALFDALPAGGRLAAADYFLLGDPVHDRGVTEFWMAAQTMAYAQWKIPANRVAPEVHALHQRNGWHPPPTQGEIRKALETAGFHNIQFTAAGSPLSVVRADRPGGTSR